MREANPLKEFDQEHENTQVPILPPDGTYTMCITRFEAGYTEKNDEGMVFPKLKWLLRVLGSSEKFTPCFKDITFYPDAHWFAKESRKKDLIAMGHTGPLSDLWNPEERGRYINKCLRVTKKTTEKEDKTYTNYNFKGIVEVANLEEQLAAAQGGGGGGGPNSNVPF